MPIWRKFRYRRLESQRGATLVLAALTIFSVLGFMFLTIQTMANRVHSYQQLYLSYQAAQAGYTNQLKAQDAANSAFWVLYLGGVQNLSPMVVSANSPATDTVDFDGDGTDDTTITFEFTRTPGSSAQVAMTIDRTSSFLSGLVGFLTDTRLKTKGRAFGSGQYVNLITDMTPAPYRRPCIEKLAESFGVTLDGTTDCLGAAGTFGTGGAPTPLTDRQKLPGYLTGKLLYEGDPSNPNTPIQNCADPYNQHYDTLPDPLDGKTQVERYFGRVAVNMFETDMPGIPNQDNSPPPVLEGPEMGRLSWEGEKTSTESLFPYAAAGATKATGTPAPTATVAPSPSPSPSPSPTPTPIVVHYNGFCRNPWEPYSPEPADCCGQAPTGQACTTPNSLVGYQCPSQKRELTRRGDYFVQQKKGYEIIAQAISAAEYKAFTWYVLGGPTPAGAILEHPTGSADPLFGAYKIFDGSNALREPVNPVALNLVSISGTGSGGSGAPSCSTFTVNNPANIQMGADRLSEWTGRVSPRDLPEIYINNHVGNSAGHVYLKPLKDPYGIGFDNILSGPTGFTGATHPAYVGFNSLGYTGGMSSTYFSPWEPDVTDPNGNWPDRPWYPAYEVDPDTGAVLDGDDDPGAGVEFGNPSANYYAFNLFAGMQAIKGGRDLRGAFKLAKDECVAKRALHGEDLGCLTIAIVIGPGDLRDNGTPVACTTLTTIDQTAHNGLIQGYLHDLDNLGNTAEILVFMAPDGATATAGSPYEGMTRLKNLFNNSDFPHRFLFNMEINLLTEFYPSFKKILESVSLLLRDKPILTTS